MTTNMKTWDRLSQSRALPLGVFVVLALLAQIPVILLGGSVDPLPYFGHLTGAVLGSPPFMDQTVGLLDQALNHFFVQSLLDRQSIWWDPYVGLGVPFVQALQPGALYPITLITNLLGLENSGIDVANLANMVIAGYGTWILARRLGISWWAAITSGALFMLSGSFVWLGTLFSNTAAFLPWMGWAALAVVDPARKTTWPVAALAAISFVEAVGGFPDIPFLGVLFFVVPLVILVAAVHKWRARRLVYALEGMAVGVAGAAFLIVPFLAALRFDRLWNSPLTAFVFLPLHVDLAWVVPFIFGRWFSPDISVANWYTLGGYTGTLPTVLALAGAVTAVVRRSWVWVGLAVVAALGVLQADGLGLARIVAHVPLLDVLPLSRLSMVTITLTGALLSGYALTAARRRLAGAILAAFGIVLGLAIFHERALLTSHLQAASAGLALALAAAGLAATTFFSRRAWWAAGLTLMAVLELLVWSNVDLLHLAPRSAVWARPAYITYLKTHAGASRIVSLDGRLQPGYSSDYGLRDIWEFAATMPLAYAEFVRRYVDPSAPLPAFMRFPGTTLSSQELTMLELMGVEWVTAPIGPSPNGALRLVERDPGADTAVYRIPTRTSLAWWPEGITGGRGVFSPAPLSTAEVPRAARKTFHGRVRLLSLAADRNGSMDAVVRTSERRLLVFRTETYPGWQATVNGRAVPITPVDGVFQGVWVPPGVDAVHLQFTPIGLPYGLAMTGMAGLWLVMRVAAESRRQAHGAGQAFSHAHTEEGRSLSS